MRSANLIALRVLVAQVRAEELARNDTSELRKPRHSLIDDSVAFSTGNLVDQHVDNLIAAMFGFTLKAKPGSFMHHMFTSLPHFSRDYGVMRQERIRVRASDDNDDKPDAFALSSEDMATLRKRMAELKERESKLQILVLDATLPGQRLSLTFPSSDTARRLLAGTCLGANVAVGDNFGMLGIWPPQSGQALPVGTQMEVTCVLKLANGDTKIELTGARRFQVKGQPWKEHGVAMASVEYMVDSALDSEGELTEEIMQMSTALGPLVEEWQRLVVLGGFERQPSQIELILSHIGSIPPASEPARRAVWVCALVNPLPALGVAYEVRPALLLAGKNTTRMLEVATQGIKTSIDRLNEGKRF